MYALVCVCACLQVAMLVIAFKAECERMGHFTKTEFLRCFRATESVLTLMSFSEVLKCILCMFDNVLGCTCASVHVCLWLCLCRSVFLCVSVLVSVYSHFNPALLLLSFGCSCSTPEELSAKLGGLRRLLEDRAMFKAVYRYAFAYVKSTMPSRQRSVDTPTAKEMMRLLLRGRWTLLNEFFAFLDVGASA